MGNLDSYQSKACRPKLFAKGLSGVLRFGQVVLCLITVSMALDSLGKTLGADPFQVEASRDSAILNSMLAGASLGSFGGIPGTIAGSILGLSVGYVGSGGLNQEGYKKILDEAKAHKAQYESERKKLYSTLNYGPNNENSNHLLSYRKEFSSEAEVEAHFKQLQSEAASGTGIFQDTDYALRAEVLITELETECTISGFKKRAVDVLYDENDSRAYEDVVNTLRASLFNGLEN